MLSVPQRLSLETQPPDDTKRRFSTDGNENVKTAIGLLSKTKSLHVHQAFLHISLSFLDDYDVKMPNFAFYGGRVNKRQRNFLSLSKLECLSQEINSSGIWLQ